MNRKGGFTVLFIFALALSCSLHAQSFKMTRTHYRWSWKAANGQTQTVARTNLYWGKDDGTFPRHMIRSVTLFKDQDGHHWIVDSRYLSSPELFVLRFTLMETGDQVRVSMRRKNGNDVYAVTCCGIHYAVKEGQQGTVKSRTYQRRLFKRLSAEFLPAFAEVKPWIEKGYLGANCLTFLCYAFDFDISGKASAKGSFAQSTLQPLRPAPVDCSFDASFGFPCGSAESAGDARGLIYKSKGSIKSIPVLKDH